MRSEGLGLLQVQVWEENHMCECVLVRFLKTRNATTNRLDLCTYIFLGEEGNKS